jgi:hypothetical protein
MRSFATTPLCAGEAAAFDERSHCSPNCVSAFVLLYVSKVCCASPPNGLVTSASPHLQQGPRMARNQPICKPRPWVGQKSFEHNMHIAACSDSLFSLFGMPLVWCIRPSMGIELSKPNTSLLQSTPLSNIWEVCPRKRAIRYFFMHLYCLDCSNSWSEGLQVK